MRGLIIAAVAFTVIAFAPSSQASPLIPAGAIANAAQDDVVAGALASLALAPSPLLALSPLLVSRQPVATAQDQWGPPCGGPFSLGWVGLA